VVKYLRAKGAVSRDEATHEVRKGIKKARALLRLVRFESGDVYAAENAVLREAGQKLSQLRDTSALIEAFDEIKTRVGKTVDKRSLGSFRRTLTLHKEHVEQELGVRSLMEDLAATLVPRLQSIKRWPLDTDGFPAIESGLEKTFHDGKKALAVARKHGSREEFHEWRKRVKDHWYQIRLLENLWSEVMTGYEQSLKELERALGEDLNLAILRDHILSASRPPGERRLLDRIVKAIDASRAELRQRALAIGERVYARKPRQFTKQMRRLWEAWQENPI
jgi:CHAD domain-containing protein